MLAPTPSQRIVRTCTPINWGGNLVVSITQLVTPKYQASVQHAFEKLDYGCRFSLWRLFYEKEYLKQEREAVQNG